VDDIVHAGGELAGDLSLRFWHSKCWILLEVGLGPALVGPFGGCHLFQGPKGEVAEG